MQLPALLIRIKHGHCDPNALEVEDQTFSTAGTNLLKAGVRPGTKLVLLSAGKKPMTVEGIYEADAVPEKKACSMQDPMIRSFMTDEIKRKRRKSQWRVRAFQTHRRNELNQPTLVGILSKYKHSQAPVKISHNDWLLLCRNVHGL